MLLFMLGFAFSVLIAISSASGHLRGWFEGRQRVFGVGLIALVVAASLPLIFAYGDSEFLSLSQGRLTSWFTGCIAGFLAYQLFRLLNRTSEGESVIRTDTDLAFKTIALVGAIALGLLLLSAVAPHLDLWLRGITKIQIGVVSLETEKRAIADIQNAESKVSRVYDDPRRVALERLRVSVGHAYDVRPASDSRLCYYQSLNGNDDNARKDALGECLRSEVVTANLIFQDFYRAYVKGPLQQLVFSPAANSEWLSSKLSDVSANFADLLRSCSGEDCATAHGEYSESTAKRKLCRLIKSVGRLSSGLSDDPETTSADRQSYSLHLRPDCHGVIRSYDLPDFAVQLSPGAYLKHLSRSVWSHHLAANLIALQGESALAFDMIGQFRSDWYEQTRRVPRPHITQMLIEYLLLHFGSSVYAGAAAYVDNTGERGVSHAMAIFEAFTRLSSSCPGLLTQDAAGEPALCEGVVEGVRGLKPEARPCSVDFPPVLAGPEAVNQWRPNRHCVQDDYVRARVAVMTLKETAAFAIFMSGRMDYGAISRGLAFSEEAAWLFIDQSQNTNWSRVRAPLSESKGFNPLAVLSSFEVPIIGASRRGERSGDFHNFGRLIFETLGIGFVSVGTVQKTPEDVQCGIAILRELRERIDDAIVVRQSACRGRDLSVTATLENCASMVADSVDLASQIDRIDGRIQVAYDFMPELRNVVTDSSSCRVVGKGLRRLWKD